MLNNHDDSSQSSDHLNQKMSWYLDNPKSEDYQNKFSIHVSQDI